MATAPVTGHRSLADQLRSWPDERVAALLVARPDLAMPPPQDFGQLASRATVRASVARALDELTRLELAVLDALVVLVEASAKQLRGAVHAEPGSVDDALALLLDRALAWQAPGGLRALSGVGESLRGAPGSSGLWPRSAEPPSATEVGTQLAELSAPARAMLEHVDAHGGEARAGSARTQVNAESASSPAEELIARRLLVPRPGHTTLHLPGEVGLVLRGGHTTVEPVDAVPPAATAERAADLVDRAAAGAAFELVRRTELLLDTWGARPPSVLRTGGLGVRDLRLTARLLQVDEPSAALVVETAHAARLLSQRADAQGDLVWVPTDAYDAWLEEPVAHRWTRLARAWLDNPRAAALVGTRDAAGKTRNALSPESSPRWLLETRRLTLRLLAELPAGSVLASGTGAPSLAEQVAWWRPRRPPMRSEQVAWTLTEAAVVGLGGLGGAASYASGLLARQGTGSDPTDRLAGLLPDPVDHVLLQADLTAVAPGPLETRLARSLQLVADVESRGGATVYRFTPGSVRRALDVGWSAAEVHDFIGSVSRTPVPQPLSYLVDDVVRTFGTVRVGAAEAFLRADDEAALAELVHHPKTAGLGLRRLAPTVLVSSTPLDLLLPRLRELGIAPVVEGPDGVVQVLRPDVLRARTPAEQSRPPWSTPPSATTARESAREQARAAAAVAAVRSGDRIASAAPARGSAPLSAADSMAALREALEAGRTVVIGYVDQQGVNADRVVDPLSIDGGSLTARDHRADDVRSFAVHRITTVRTLDAD